MQENESDTIQYSQRDYYSVVRPGGLRTAATQRGHAGMPEEEEARTGKEHDMKTGTAQAQQVSPWEALETGATAWEDFSSAEQEEVVRHYAPKIRFLALRLKSKLPRSVELGEMISSGTLGLMEALGKFRPQLGILL